ncbi:retrovirus-related pol polyprotein from transposon TNT 1-94 [Tanacetum coccineum]|uniref:Retrovirus-related pol polyprotein from transposon TNT 1-94 n=1 Tax=Tanacetum coccineum TaxID=301880 RepID=A0ABQ5IZA5_9ASTR
MTTAGIRAVVNTGKGKLNTDLKKSRWVWRPKGNYLDHVSKDSGYNHGSEKANSRTCSRSSVVIVNGVAARKNRTLIEAARTMLADSFLPIPFWAEAVNTACYVLNRILVTKPQNKTPYELLIDSLDKDDQGSEDAAVKEEQHQMKESEKDLQDELEMMVTQEFSC